jgi:hypothetical protein
VVVRDGFHEPGQQEVMAVLKVPSDAVPRAACGRGGRRRRHRAFLSASRREGKTSVRRFSLAALATAALIGIPSGATAAPPPCEAGDPGRTTVDEPTRNNPKSPRRSAAMWTRRGRRALHRCRPRAEQAGLPVGKGSSITMTKQDRCRGLTTLALSVGATAPAFAGLEVAIVVHATLWSRRCHRGSHRPELAGRVARISNMS